MNEWMNEYMSGWVRERERSISSMSVSFFTAVLAREENSSQVFSGMLHTVQYTQAVCLI